MRTAVRVAAVAALAAIPAVVGTVTHADVFFRATAVADGMNTIVGGGGVPFGAVTEGGSPAAQAVLDSLGNSHGYAANPYPGDFVVSVPGTVAGILPVPASVPGYPAYVSSDSATQPEAHADFGAYSLSSTSEDSGTHATGTEGAEENDEGYATADAQSRTTDGSNVHAVATSTVSGFAVPGVLSFGTVTTTAEVTRDASSRPQAKASIQVWGATLAGQPVGFADGHFVAPGTDQPLPANPLADVLGGAGVSVQYVAAQRLPNGIASPAVEVTVTQEAPAGNPASGKYTVTYVLGRSIATVDVNGRDASTSTGTGTTGAFQSPSGPAGRGAGSSSASGVPDTGTDLQPGGTGGSGPSNNAPVVAPPQPSSTPPAQTALAASTPGHVETVDIYLAIVIAACCLVASSQLVRYLGIRYGWR